MNILRLSLALVLLCAAPAYAQGLQELDTPADPAIVVESLPTETTPPVTTTPAAVAEDIEPKAEAVPDLQLKDTKAREFEDAPVMRLRILDKVRAESRTYELNVGRTVAYANLRIRPRTCRKSSPLDEPESAAFLQIWEVKPDDSSAWVFSGWMFASSPSLSAMDHPVYDVTVLECKLPPKPEEPKAEEPTTGDDATVDAEDDAQSDDQGTDGTVVEEPVNDTPETPSAPSSSE